eukprot:534347-Pelagomonas_calceolata.AAC.3
MQVYIQDFKEPCDIYITAHACHQSLFIDCASTAMSGEEYSPSSPPFPPVLSPPQHGLGAMSTTGEKGRGGKQ